MKSIFETYKTVLILLLLHLTALSLFAESGIYVGGHFRRNRTVTVPALKASGFTYVILFNIQVEANGDLTTDGETICSNGVYVFGNTQPNYISDVMALKSGMTSIRRVECCIGGWGSVSYDNIKKLIASQGIGASSILYKNFQALKNAIPCIDAINNDDEKTYDVSAATSFSVMLYDLGYKTSLAPYMNKNFWQNVATNVNNLRPGAVDRIYLQCYDGGFYNNPANWNINNITMHAGMLTYFSTSGKVSKPDSIRNTMTNWKNTSNVTGGFYWVYNDETIVLKNFASYVNGVFGGGDVVNMDKMESHITAYSDINYQGTAVDFEVGIHNMATLTAHGLADKSISSIKISPGFQVNVFRNTDLTGASVSINQSTPDLSSLGINDAISSMKVRANGDTTLVNKKVYIKNRANGMFMTLASDTILVGLSVQQKAFTGNTNQEWLLGHLNDGAYRIINRFSNRTLQIRDASDDNGAVLEQGRYLAYAYQKFVFIKNPDSGFHQLIPFNSMKFLQVDSEQINILNADIIQGDDNGLESNWEIIPNYSILKPHVVLYPDCSYAGQGVNYELGNYSNVRMNIFGISAQTISSVKITPGYKLTLYKSDNQTGDSLILTQDNNCLSGLTFDNMTTSFKVELVDPDMGIKENQVSSVSVYPTLVSDFLYVQDRQNDIERIEITNLEGTDLQFHEKNLQKIDVSALSDGMYFIKIYPKGSTIPQTMKFIKY